MFHLPNQASDIYSCKLEITRPPEISRQQVPKLKPHVYYIYIILHIDSVPIYYLGKPPILFS